MAEDFLAGLMRASSSVIKVEKGVRRKECENSREFGKRKAVNVLSRDVVERSA
jgi:hypothetical protein